ncbi:MAG TPA: hypothetical protein VK548_24115 [Candidatus Acidoferrum sp.]|nr:hypothetical protein [Candidatus Acidoferrum sp.]
MPARSLVVVMPFGGRGELERRRAILRFKRLEYLIRTKCHVTATMPNRATEPVAYAVELARTAMDDIPEKALQQIDSADVLIALVAENNPNVIYEVAYRRARDRTVVLVVDSADDLPLYVRSLAYQSWKQDEVLKRIDTIAGDNGREVRDFNMGIPDDLKKAIDENDGVLQEGLEAALFEVEKNFKLRVNEAVEHLRGIVSDKTVSFYPNSIVKVEFSARSTFDEGQAAEVVDFDNAFSQLYGYANKQDAETDLPLTLAKLLARVKKISDPEHWAPFEREQGDLTEVLKRYDFARAKEPLRVNQTHRWREYRGTAYLPCVVAEVIDRPKDGPHTMYLLIVYIELPETLTVITPAAGARQ